MIVKKREGGKREEEKERALKVKAIERESRKEKERAHLDVHDLGQPSTPHPGVDLYQFPLLLPSEARLTLLHPTQPLSVLSEQPLDAPE